MRQSYNLTSPLLASKTPVWRSKLVVGVLVSGFTVLIARASYVQVFNNNFFQHQGEVRFGRTLELPASRGQILDRNGLVMASSVIAPSVWAVPEDLEISAEQRQKLAKILELPVAELNKKLKVDNRNFVWVKRQVNQSIANQVEALKIKGIYTRKEYRRQYPAGEAAAHVIGTTNVDDIGKEGAELAFNAELAGHMGKRRVIKDRLGRVVETVGDEVPPEAGQDIVLSIDSKIQFFAYQKLRESVQEHNAKSGSVVVLDANSGEVLAMANYPSFVPQDRSKASNAQARNLVITDSFEPGSAMKPISVSLALDHGIAKPDTPVVTAAGSMQIGGFTFRDVHAHNKLTVEQVIQKSSNVGTVRLGMQVPDKDMWEAFVKLGFGQKPEIAFPGASSGRLRGYKNWRPIEKATMTYGYGLSTSLLQIARAYTVFANDGHVIPLSLLKVNEPIKGTRVFSAKTAAQMRKMLQMAAGPGGTGERAQTIGYTVGGKSGTAHKQEGKGYASNKYRSWFVGLAPIEKPRIVVAVMIDEPKQGGYYGGVVAAPIFSQTVQQSLRLLGLQPDMSVKPAIFNETVQENLQ